MANSAFLNMFLQGTQAGNRDKVMARQKALDALSGLELFGGSPSDELAANLQETLGMEWPTQDPSTVEPPLRPGRRSIPGSIDLQQQLLDIKRINAEKDTGGDLTTDKLRAALMRRQAQGLSLTPEQEGVLKTLNMNRQPFFAGQLPQGELPAWARIQAGLDPDANTSENIAAKAAQFAQGQERLERAMAALDARFQKQYGATQDYRTKQLMLARTKAALQNTMLQALLAGEDIPQFDFQTLFNVDFESPEDVGYDLPDMSGGGQGNMLDMNSLILRLSQIQDPEERKMELKKELAPLLQLLNETTQE